MQLGQKLKEARLEKGLSQRQLCQNIITRNMLSLIENGSAKPSRSTLQALCARLELPLSHFIADAPSENLQILSRATSEAPRDALKILESYVSPDALLDGWYHYLCLQKRLCLAKEALQDHRSSYAATLLKECDFHLDYNPPLRGLFIEEYALLCHEAELLSANQAAALLPSHRESLFLQAKAAFQRGDYPLCLTLLDSASPLPHHAKLLQCDALLALKEYSRACPLLLDLEHTQDLSVYSRLESCYREQGDFEKAYYYACKQR